MSKNKSIQIIAITVMIGLPLILTDTALAQSAGGVGQVENFIRNVIQVLAGLAGLIATGFLSSAGLGI